MDTTANMTREASHDVGDVSAPIITNHFFALAEANVASQTPTQAPTSSGSPVKTVLLVSAAVNVLLVVALFVVKVRKQQQEQQATHERSLGTPSFDDSLQTSSSLPVNECSSSKPTTKPVGATPMPLVAPVLMDTLTNVISAPADILDDGSDSDQDVYVRTSSTVSYIRFSGYPRSDESDSFRSSRSTGDWRAYLLSSGSSSLGSLSPFSSEGDVESPTTRSFETELTTPPLPPDTPPTVVEIVPEVSAAAVDNPLTTSKSPTMAQLPSVVSLFRSVTVNRLLAFRTKRGMHAAADTEACYV